MTQMIESVRRARLASALLLACVTLAAVACGGAPGSPAAPSTNPSIAPSQTFSATTPLTGAQAVAGTKVDICHRTSGDNAFIALSVAPTAVEAHLAHGDGLVGSPVPGVPGMKFAADCSFLAVVAVVDQSNITYLSFGGDGAPGSAVNPTQSVAQTFTVGLSGLLSRIDLGLYRDAAALTGDVTVDILPASVLPAYEFGSSLFTMTIPIASIPLLTTNLTTIDLSAANLAVNAGQQLAIVLRRPAGAGWVIWQDSNPAVPYDAGGSFTWHPAGWPAWIPVGGDHRFQTWVLP